MNQKAVRFISKRLTSTGKRQRFLSFARAIALISVFLGSMALIISLSVLDGFNRKLHENAEKFTAHITIKSFNRKPFKAALATIDRLRSHYPEIKAAAPLVEFEGLISTKAFVEGTVMRGVYTQYDITNIKDNIVEGRFGFSDDYAKEIIIGRRLADKLAVRLDSMVVIYTVRDYSLAGLPDPQIDKFRVTGIYETGMSQYDDIIAYLPYKTAASYLNIDVGSATTFEVLLNDPSKAKAIAEDMDLWLGYPYYCITMYDIHSHIFAWIDLQKEPIPIVLGLISIVAVLNIITTLLVTVVEKTHTIGVLRVLGMKNKDIISMFTYQGIRLGLLGSILGSAVGLVLCIIQQQFNIIRLQGDIYFLDSLPVSIIFWHYAIVIGITLILSYMATLVPSIAAIRRSPVAAIRFK